MLEVRNLVKSFAGGRGERDRRIFAVNDVSFDVEEGELFPQPDGPSSVKSSPSSTSNETSSTAKTRLCWSPRAGRERLRRGCDVEHGSRLPDARSCAPSLYATATSTTSAPTIITPERRDAAADGRAVLLPDHDREHLLARRVEQHGAAELAHRDDQDVDPAGDEARARAAAGRSGGTSATSRRRSSAPTPRARGRSGTSRSTRSACRTA